MLACILMYVCKYVCIADMLFVRNPCIYVCTYHLTCGHNMPTSKPPHALAHRPTTSGGNTRRMNVKLDKHSYYSVQIHRTYTCPYIHIYANTAVQQHIEVDFNGR